jgi:hypothetical protein
MKKINKTVSPKTRFNELKRSGHINIANIAIGENTIIVGATLARIS